MSVDNAAIARTLETIAHILDVEGENPFKVRAYVNAARLIEGLPGPLAERVKDGTLGELPGIGEALQQKLTELVTTGRLAYLEKLKAQVPEGVLDMLAIPGLGPKGVHTLWKEMGLSTLSALEKACKEGFVARRKGFGEKSQAKILEGIAFLRKNAGSFLLGDALSIGRELIGVLEASGRVKRVSLAGSARRGKSLIGDLDLVASAPAGAPVMETFLAWAAGATVVASGDTKTSVRLQSGLQVDLRVVSDEEYPCALQYFTGSREHNIALRARAQSRGLKLNEYGLFKGERRLPVRTEAECYKRLGLDFVPPELRENQGEMAASETGKLPILVEARDLRGVFHVHTEWSDGHGSIEEMARQARSLGLKYIGVSDHSQVVNYANGLDERRLREQGEAIRKLNARLKGFRVLHGTECDIMPDGSLDYPPEVLRGLDFVIGSVHSSFRMPLAEMTARVCKALENEHMHILGHPTGRLLLERDAYALDLERVIAAAARHGKAIEINCHPQRLDLESPYARRAAALGVGILISPDAHWTGDFANIPLGVTTARRGWLTKDDVVNCLPWQQALAALVSGPKKR